MQGAPIVNTGYASNIGGVNVPGGVGTGVGVGVGVGSLGMGIGLDGLDTTRFSGSHAVDNLWSTRREVGDEDLVVHHHGQSGQGQGTGLSFSTGGLPLYDPSSTGKRGDDEGMLHQPNTEIRFGYGSQWKK